MPITFGSVGDIISLSLLIKDLVKSLDDSRGSLAEYQAVIRELWSLDHTLLEVVVLFRSCKQTTELNALSATAVECAEQCRKCIASFHEQTRTLKRSLQSGGSGSKIRDALSKVRWQVSEKENLAKFRAGINAHCLSMNLLLTTTGITLTKLNDENLQTYLEQAKLARAKSSAMQASDLVRIKGLLEENNTLAKVAASKTKDFRSRFDIDYFRSIGSDMLAFVQKIWQVLDIASFKTPMQQLTLFEP